VRVVLDTNVIVSALWSPDGTSAQAVGIVLDGQATLCYDMRLLAEYHEVLARPRLALDPKRVARLLDDLVREGLPVIAPRSDIPLPDEDDRPFLDIALAADAWLVTGNIKHFPPLDLVKTVRSFVDQFATA
jgi:putative PIN family toxin of toxin-antitoxin system